MAESKFLNLNTILSRGAEMNIISSPRGPGKSFALKQRVLELFFLRGEEFIYVRRTHEEIKSTKDTHFNDVLEILYHGKYEMKSIGDKFYIRETQPIELTGKELKEWKDSNPWKLCGYAISVSRQQNYKSSSFPKVTTIYYDEFIPDSKYSRQDETEPILFEGLVETVARKRPKGACRVFMLSNTGFATNPYFKKFNIRSGDFMNQEFIYRNNKNVCMWYFRYKGDDLDDALDRASVRIFGNAGSSYSIDGDFKDLNGKFVKPKPKKMDLQFQMEDSGEFYSVCYYEEGYWVFKDKRRADYKSFTFGSWDLSQYSFYDRDFINKLKSIFHRRNLHFSDDNTQAFFLKKLLK